MSAFQKGYNNLETQSEFFPGRKFSEHAVFFSKY